MDSFFGIGGAELIVILILAGLVMGPERIRGVARYLGRITAQLQAISKEFARQLNAELDSIEGGDVRSTMQDVQDLRRQVQELRRELADTPRQLARDGQDAVREGRQAVDEALTESTASGSEQQSVPRLPTPVDVPDDRD